MDAKFFDSLFEGDGYNGLKLCMGLSGGDFWVRPNGCSNLYRGTERDGVDFNNIITVENIDAKNISTPGYLEHAASTDYVYTIRRASGCGEEEVSDRAITFVSFDAEADLQPPACNGVLRLSCRRYTQNKIKLCWAYIGFRSGAKVDKFAIYSNGGSGAVDYASAIAETGFVCVGEYSMLIEVSGPAKYIFAAAGIDYLGRTGPVSAETEIYIQDEMPDSAEIISAKVF